MKEFIEKLIGRLEELSIPIYDSDGEIKNKVVFTDIAKNIVNELAEEYKLLENIEQLNNGWIPCSRELPPQPKENPLFEYKPLELYLVSLSSTDYPWRAFWNGKYFTDGFSKVEPIAWMPLPAPYKEEGE